MTLKSIRLFGLCILFTGCAYFSKTSVEETPASVYPAPDPEIAQILDVYRDSLNEVMGQKVATVHDTLRFGKPEGPLNNYVADALRYRAANELQEFVHVGVIGESSFKLYFVPGELTRGDIYEFIPYENHLVVLTLDGRRLMKLIEQVAALGGAPVSGVRFRIDENGNPNGVLVNAEVIDLQGQYLVATSSWAANGGDQFPALWQVSNRIDFNVPIQDLYVDYFKNQVELTDATDGRIRR